MTDLRHDYGFDPTHGYTPDRLLTIEPPPEPADLEAFWQGTYRATVATPLEIEVSAHATSNAAFRVRHIRFTGFEKVRLGAWLIEPSAGPVDHYMVTGHGYYNRPFEDLHYAPRTANLFFGSRGLSCSPVDGIPDQTLSHVLHGIESKETYVHRGCVADVWAAASVMLELFPQAAGLLHYRGDSFGGGIGAMALPWDHRFATADIRVPSFGHHPIRLACRCTGSGEAVRRRVRNNPEILENTLRYFDAAIHARRIRIPTAFACALFDPAVPPPGQFAVHNAAACDKTLTVWRTGHHDWAGTNDGVAAADQAVDEMLRRVRESRI